MNDIGRARDQAGQIWQPSVQHSDVVITMGCGDACPFYPGKRYEDWTLDDPAGLSIEQVRPIREEIKRRIGALIVDLLGEARPVG